MAKVSTEIRAPIEIYSELISENKSIAQATAKSLVKIRMRSLAKFKAFNDPHVTRKPEGWWEEYESEEDDPIIEFDAKTAKFKVCNKAEAGRKPKLSKKIKINIVEEDDPISAACIKAAELKSKEISVHKSDYHAAAQPVEPKTLDQLEDEALFDCMSPAGAYSEDFFV